jgi:hypothetical protein
MEVSIQESYYIKLHKYAFYQLQTYIIALRNLTADIIDVNNFGKDFEEHLASWHYIYTYN